jgi:hypothetical protein
LRDSPASGIITAFLMVATLQQSLRERLGLGALVQAIFFVEDLDNVVEAVEYRNPMI